MIVVDTNVVVAVVVRGANTPDALAVRARDNDWIAPSLLQSEVPPSVSPISSPVCKPEPTNLTYAILVHRKAP
jgi:hypothetical protein